MRRIAGVESIGVTRCTRSSSTCSWVSREATGPQSRRIFWIISASSSVHLQRVDELGEVERAWAVSGAERRVARGSLRAGQPARLVECAGDVHELVSRGVLQGERECTVQPRRSERLKRLELVQGGGARDLEPIGRV